MRVVRAVGVVCVGFAASCSPQPSSTAAPVSAARPAPNPSPASAEAESKPPAIVDHAAESATGIYRVGGNVVPPTVLHRENLDFGRFRERRIVGVPAVEAVIDERGVVKDVRILRATDPEIDAAFVAAVKKWRFQPATLNGKPVPVYFVLTVNIDFQ